MSEQMSDVRTVNVWGGQLQLRVNVFGEGPALLYLHPAAGFAMDPFLQRLATHYTIYAPEFPGTSADDPYAVRKLDELSDVVLAYEELIRKLDLDKPVVVGQSFGGMLAAELAANFTTLFARMILLDPVGLWRDDAPVANWIAAPPEELPAMLFHDPQSPAAQQMLAMPEDPELAVKAAAGLVWALGCTGKFLWPIPDRGLSKRLHRVAVPTQIIWGEHDALISSVYAEEFGKRIADSRVNIIRGSGHIPQVEQMEDTYQVVADFLEVS